MKKPPPEGRKKAEVVDPLLLDFMAYMSLERGRGELTVNAYARDLHEFGAWLTQVPASESPMNRVYARLSSVTSVDIGRYIRYLMGPKKYNARTVCRKLSSIKALYKFMKAQHLREDNPAIDIPGPRIKKNLPHSLAEAEVETLLATAPKVDYPDELRRRDRAIMELFYATGMRRAEIASAQISELDLSLRTLRVEGKGNKQRLVAFNTTTAEAIQRYIEVRPRTSDNALFLSHRGSRLSPKHIWFIFKQIYKLSGVDAPAGPHTMRHSFATHMIEHGADLETVRELLGHESLATTGIYLKLSMVKKKQVYDVAHPRDRMRTGIPKRRKPPAGSR